MKNVIKRILLNSEIGSKVLELIQLSRLVQLSFGKNNKVKLPTSIQLPITNRCNSRCEMCDVWQMDTSGEMDINEFQKILSDPLFSQINSVGINGVEPTLVHTIDQ